MKDREFWLRVRQAMLMLVDTVERQLGVRPRTADLRRKQKQGRIENISRAQRSDESHRIGAPADNEGGSSPEAH